MSISWTDGPTVQAVEEVTWQFEGKGFDGMTDSTYCKDAVMPDGRRSGLGYVHTSRRISAALARRCIAQIAEYWGGVDYRPEVEDGSLGFNFVNRSDLFRLVRQDLNLDWQVAICRAASDRTTYQRETE